MRNSDLSPKLSIPSARSKSEVGIWLQDFLRSAAQNLPESHLPAFLKAVFRWLLQIEGVERVSEEELRLRKERFYFLLPEELRTYFPWEAPTLLPDPPPPHLTYPQERTPFRQYGLLARRWIEALGNLPKEEQNVLGNRLVRHLYHQLRHQGLPIEESTLIENIASLSPIPLHLTPQGLSERSVVEFSERTHRKHRPFRHRR